MREERWEAGGREATNIVFMSMFGLLGKRSPVSVQTLPKNTGIARLWRHGKGLKQRKTLASSDV